MKFTENIRHELPPVDVYTQTVDRNLHPASQMLTDDVREDLSQTRARIVEVFGQQDIPPLDTGLYAEVASYFSECGWSLPKSVVINPTKDTVELRAVLHDVVFPSTSDEEFFTGLNGQVMSPGGSAQRDIVIFHDWRSKYRQDIRQLVTEWGYSISDESLDRAAELKVADFVVHELAHLAGGLAVAAVVIEMIDGRYHLADRAMSGFTDMRNDTPAPELDENSDYYTGTALDESWATLNASRFLFAHTSTKQRDPLSIPDRYGIIATIKHGEGLEIDYSVAGLHSGDAGIIIERIDELYPGVIAIMTEVVDRKTDLTCAMDKLKSLLPRDIMTLLNKPQHAAWQKLRKQLNI